MRAGSCTARRSLLVVLALTTLGTVASPAGAALPDTDVPSLTLVRTIRTSPFTGTSESVRDGEGSAFVPDLPAHPNIGGTDSLWLADDNGRAAWEIDPSTGALKSSIRDSGWQATKRYDALTDTGSGPTAGPNRDADLEAMAYDAATDTLYAFSGKCCSSGVLPTVFRLRRGADHTFHPDSYQPLPAGTDDTAAAWNPSDRRLYVGNGSDVHRYAYAPNESGPEIELDGVHGILGMAFSDNGADLLAVTSSERLVRVSWTTRSVRTGWDLDLTPFGVEDSRAVELTDGQIYVFDGDDFRADADPLRHAVFVFEVCCPSGAPTAPGTPVAVTGVGKATVSFTPPASTGTSPISAYRVVASPGGATCTTTGALTCTVTGLEPATAYRFRVSAENASGVGPMSPSSNAVVVLAARYTVLVSAAELASVNQAADDFGIPRAEALLTGGRLMRFLDALAGPAGLGPLAPPTASSGPGSLTASYTDPDEVAALRALAQRSGVTTAALHDIGVHVLVFLWSLGAH